MKLVKLSEEANNGKMRSPIDALEDCLKDLKEDAFFKECNKIFIIPLITKDGIYDLSWYQAGMQMSEIIGLLECAKQKIFDEIREANE